MNQAIATMAARPAIPHAMPMPADAPELSPLLGLDVDDGLAVFAAPAAVEEEAPLAVVLADDEADPEELAADDGDEVDEEATALESNRSL